MTQPEMIVLPRVSPFGVLGPPPVITRLAFDRRFTLDEAVNIELAAIDTPAGQPAARRAQASIRVAQRRLSNSTGVTLTDPELIATVQSYVTAGLLTAPRAAEILSLTIADSERP